MNCWHCKNPLTWGGDIDLEEEFYENYSIETNLLCSNCGAFVLVYLPRTTDHGSEE
jgi:hypothetical protein